MSWQLGAWLMLGGSTLLLFIGMPVALTFIAINIVGAFRKLIASERSGAFRSRSVRWPRSYLLQSVRISAA